MSEEMMQKIQLLEQELRIKDAEIARYRAALNKSNSELEKIIVDMTHELKMASLVQKLLSPLEIPNIPGFDFSTKFFAGSERGGDYFDIFEHEDRMKFGIVLACSSGYSMSALFLSVLIKLSSQIEARKGLPPDQVLTRMAKEIVPEIENQDSASVFYGVMDRRSFQFQYSSNGSMMGLLQPKSAAMVTQLLPATGCFAKGFAETPLASVVSLDSGDRLILVSEGLSHCKSPGGEEFGWPRVMDSIQRIARGTAHDIRNEILFQAQKFAGLESPVRDQTVVVMEVKDRVIKLANPRG